MPLGRRPTSQTRKVEEYRARLILELDAIRANGGAVHENKARQVFAEALLYLVSRTK